MGKKNQVPYKNIIFVKFFIQNTNEITGLPHSKKYTEDCDDDMKFIYDHAIMTAGLLKNKIPGNGKYMKRIFNLEMSEEQISQNLLKISQIFPEIKRFLDNQGNVYYSLKKFYMIHNRMPNKEGKKDDKQKLFTDTSRDVPSMPQERPKNAHGTSYNKNKNKNKKEDKEKQDRSHPLLQLQDYYFQKLKSRIDNPVFNFTVAAGCLDRLLKTQSFEEIKSTIDNFFETKDKFFINSGYDVKKFASSYNAFKIKARIPSRPTMEQMLKENPGVIKSHLEIILQDEIKKWEKEWGLKNQ